MFCSKCGTIINETEKFCTACGNEIIIITNDKKIKDKKKRRKIIISFLLCISIVFGVLCAPLISDFIASKKVHNLIEVLSDGYWMATSTENTIALDSFGFIFSNELFDQTSIFAITTNGKIMMCKFMQMDDYGVRMYSASDSGAWEGKFSFEYDKKNDTLNLTVQSVGENFFDYEVANGTKIYLSHFPETNQNTELEKKMYFNRWATVDGDYILGSPEDVLDDVIQLHPQAHIIKFNQKNNTYFTYHQDEDIMYYYPENFEIKNEYEYDGYFVISFTFDRENYELLKYDADRNCFFSDTTSKKLYCITDAEKILANVV